MVETLVKQRRTRRSTGAAGQAFSRIKGFWPPPGYLGRYPNEMSLVARLSLLIFALLVASIGCDRSPRVPPYQFIDDAPIFTSRSADDAILLATDYCKRNGIKLENRRMPVMSYDSLDGVGYWCVLYHGMTRTPGDHFMLLIEDASGEIEYVPGE